MAEYTDEYIERVARAYCVKLGLDPDEGVQVDFDRYMLVGEFRGRVVYDAPGYLWQTYRAEVQKALAMRDALAQVAKEDALGGGDR